MLHYNKQSPYLPAKPHRTFPPAYIVAQVFTNKTLKTLTFDIQFHLNFSCAIIEYLTAFVPDALVDAIPPKLASAPGSKHEINQL